MGPVSRECRASAHGARAPHTIKNLICVLRAAAWVRGPFVKLIFGAPPKKK